MNGFYAGEKRQRGGRKKRKKNKEVHVVQNWDDIYDPSRPNSYEEYQNSDEKILEIREWKDRLYAHRVVRSRGDSIDSSSDDSQRPQQTSNSVPVHRRRGLLTDIIQISLRLPLYHLLHQRTLGATTLLSHSSMRLPGRVLTLGALAFRLRCRILEVRTTEVG